jgi:crotonobetainyl-CoA:carnitine CoA-transferase CaiB-like acyl-CoA transferase
MLPLSGMRVIAVEQYGAGPYGTMQLADLGAEVIKIENIREGGDISRQVGPHLLGEQDSQFFEAFNRNKRSVGLDLKHPDGLAILRRLAACSDTIFNNLRGDLPAQLGLDYAALEDVNPAIVCVHLSAYGRTGSRAAWPGYDYLMQAEAGYLSLTGEPEGPPARFGLSMIDLMTGTTAAMAILTGLLEARRTGRGRDYDVSLFDVALHNLAYIATWYLNGGTVTTRIERSSHPSLTPSQLYRTRDGWIFLMCNKEKFWRELTAATGLAHLRDDPAYRDFASRLTNRDALTGILDEALMRKDTREWVELLAGKVPCAPVLNIAEALENPFVHERDAVMSFIHPQHGPIPGIVSPVRAGGSAHPANAAPALGEFTDELLASLGYSPEEMRDLRDKGAIQ